jgi:hypothetical protein
MSGEKGDEEKRQKDLQRKDAEYSPRSNDCFDIPLLASLPAKLP